MLCKNKLTILLQLKSFLYNMYLLTSSSKVPSLSTTKLRKGKNKMANIKSAKKRVLVAEKNRLRNVAFKTSIKTAVKKVLELAKSENKDELNSAMSKVYQLCDKAVGKGILHKNTAARKKSRLTIAVNKSQAK